jgi:hypothetical protein
MMKHMEKDEYNQGLNSDLLFVPQFLSYQACPQTIIPWAWLRAPYSLDLRVEWPDKIHDALLSLISDKHHFLA